MTHVARRESWKEAPRAIAYFCNVLPDDAGPGAPADPAVGAEYMRRRKNDVRRNAIRFMNADLCRIWSDAHDRGSFDWKHLHAVNSTPDGEDRFATQYWTANVRPSDRYTQTLPGSPQFRISPLDGTYDNLTLAGDWTSCGLNSGCVEAAVMSGLLASHAITRYPVLSDIVGYDHP
jgi:hypothetical protein